MAFVAVIAIAGWTGINRGFDFTSAGNLSANPEPSEKVIITNPFPKPEIGEPVRLVIPKLTVDAVIENVGLTDENAMDVPKEKGNAGWYELGAKPGELGSAVIAGHLDDKNGDPEVFYNLKDISAGDEIEVEDENGKKYTYVVTRVQTYPYASFPLQEVFASSDKTRLNLITCEGTYDKSSKLYSDRLVVYSELKE